MVGKLEEENYKIIEFPKSRIGTFDVGIIGNKKHHVSAIIEIDVTDARKEIRELRANKKISFTAWLLKAISDTLMQHKEICGYIISKNKKVVFNDISFTITIEKNINEVKVPIPLLLENINDKTVEEITNIIENAKKSEIKNRENNVINNKFSELQMKVYYTLPRFLRIWLMKSIINDPFLSKKVMGNVMFTSLGMIGKIPGWIIPKSYHNLCFAVGSITKKPWIIDGKIEIREIMNMTILFNHDVVDGVPMARFVSELIKRIENPNKKESPSHNSQ